MKLNKLKTVSKYFLYMVLVAVFYSCERPKQPIANFCGGVIYEKLSNLAGDKAFTVRYKNEFKEVFVYKLDWDKYKVNDTIKNCH